MIALVCLRCNQSNPPDANFCSACGTGLMRRLCPSCHVAIGVGAKFCDACGFRLPTAFEEDAAPGGSLVVATADALQAEPDGLDEPELRPVPSRARWPWLLGATAGTALIALLVISALRGVASGVADSGAVRRVTAPVDLASPAADLDLSAPAAATARADAAAVLAAPALAPAAAGAPPASEPIAPPDAPAPARSVPAQASEPSPVHHSATDTRAEKRTPAETRARERAVARAPEAPREIPAAGPPPPNAMPSPAVACTANAQVLGLCDPRP